MFEHLKMFLTSKTFDYYLIFNEPGGLKIAVTDQHTICIIPWIGVDGWNSGPGMVGIPSDDFEKHILPLENFPVGNLEITDGKLSIPIMGVIIDLIPSEKLPDKIINSLIRKTVPSKKFKSFRMFPETLKEIIEFSELTKSETFTIGTDGEDRQPMVFEDSEKRWKILTAPVVDDE